MMQYYINQESMTGEVFTLTQMPKSNSDIAALTYNNPLLLLVTIFAGRNICHKLKIEKYGYQLAINEKDQHKKMIILIIKSSIIEDYKLIASLNIIQALSTRIYIKRINMGIFKENISIMNKILKKQYITNIDNYIENQNNPLTKLSIFPNLPVATELCVYIHQKSDLAHFLPKYFSHKTFIIPTRAQQVFINFAWILQQHLNNQQYSFSSKMLQCKAEDNQNKYRLYLKVILKGITQQNTQNRYDQCIFSPTQTKINIHKAAHFQLDNIVKKIQLPQIYTLIFNQQCFINLRENIVSKFQQKIDKTMILLKAPKSMGISSFIHNLAQQNSYNFVKINCQYFVSDKQLYSAVKKCQNYGSSTIYIKNIDWLLELNTNKSDSQQSMKHIIRKLEQTLGKMGDKSLQSFIIIINYQGNTVKYDMTKNSHLQVFEPLKKQKISILQKVCQYYSQQNQNKIVFEQPIQVCNLLGSFLGWKKFTNVLDSLSKNKENIIQKVKTDKVLQQVSKFMQVEKVENIKNVGWDDVGGLKDAKQQIVQTILLPTKHPQIFDQWIKPRTGILFFGPPGTGKTMLGKCIANQCKMGFISVKGPELLNMYIGESQKNVRQVFQRANSNKPCIIFMDQLDALIPKRGKSSDSNQVMDRIVSELLSQMDRAAGNGIFVIGATNRPDLLDPSILRPGRFDKQIYLGILNDQSSRKQVLQAQTRHLTLDENFDFQKVLAKVPLNFTGADFYGLTSRSILKAAQRFIQKFQQGLETKEGKVILIQQDFIETVKDMKPSVSNEELKHYQKLRQLYK